MTTSTFGNTGLSVLIPVYNFDIRSLVKDLAGQLPGPFNEAEILVYDDCSEIRIQNLNREISSSDLVQYKELPENLGRSRIRNLMAGDAKFNHLLFLDCDSQIIEQSFIRQYHKHLGPDIICGGRIYGNTEPGASYRLHYRVGKTREQVSATKRSKKPFHALMFNNLLLKKEAFKNIGLDERLQGYGHEDTQFGYEAELKKYRIKHIDNACLHSDLCRSDEFLEKTRQGVENLSRIYQANEIGKETGIVSKYLLLKRFGLSSAMLSIFNLLEKKMKDHLNSDNPSLVVFDFYKLGLFLRSMRS